MSFRVALVNLGCRVNRVELDAMATRLEAAGGVLCEEGEAEFVVINTCGVTGEAEAKSRKAVRHAASLPLRPLVVATGCVASLFASELSTLAENVCVVADKRQVVDVIVSRAGNGVVAADVDLACTGNAHVTPTGRTRPGIKVQDGCDNRCTYCIVWKARGKGTSLEPSEVLARVREAQARGAHEVVLTGINLGAYRYETSDQTMRLPGLLDLILSETDIERVRLSSIEPPDVDRALLDTMASAGSRMAPFLHICLQSGCDKTLRRMARPYRTDDFRRVVEGAREALPHVSVGTDLIVGFPGETDEDFAASLAFCEEMRFSKIHVFRYSKRPGTPAASFDGQVEPKTMVCRASAARELGQRMRVAEANLLVGTCDLTLVQYPGRGVTGGLFDVLVDDELPVDSLVSVRLASALPDGTLVAEPA